MPIYSNSGVEGGSGYTFQKCCIVHLIFENFNELSASNYFICLEHHEDFLFAFLDEKGNLHNVDAYQAKKSRDDWATDKDLCEILGKISLVGNELLNDSHPKSENYSHTLSFLTNKNISLTSKKAKKGEKTERVKVQISNKIIDYTTLHDDIKSNINSHLIDNNNVSLEQLEFLNLKFIDFPQAHSGWIDKLVGMSTRIFGKRLNDHKAAIDSLVTLLTGSELTYNNNNIVSLTDKKKQVQKNDIDDAFDILFSNKKAFNFWREYSDSLSKNLRIKLPIKRKAKEHLYNCFDYFKDINEIEYRKIFKFVEERSDIDDNHIDEVDCIVELYNTYLANHQTRLEKHMIAFAIIAAYVETRIMDV